MSFISIILLPFFVLVILLSAWVKGTDYFTDFTVGAKKGISAMAGILPSLIGLFAAITVFRASGAMDAVVAILAPLGKFLGIESPLIPLVLMRPVSGSASLTILQDITTTFGPDSNVGRAAAVMMGSTETVIYTLAVYMSGNGIKKAPGVMFSALMANLVSSLLACWLCS
ncbi:MAG: spore maturation protein [Ruminococcaceae bacterium]|nr:spore maturation protein [Oscillospiraceae bacterium]